MLLTLVVSLSLTPAPIDCIKPDPEVTPGAGHVNHEELYNKGIPFEDFLRDADRRRELWLENYGSGIVPDALLARARNVRGTWYLLAVTVDSCSDSANTIPYLARLAEQVDGLEMRIVDPDMGRHIMEAHRTPDGRASTPTVVLLDESFDEVGYFIERPAQLQDWWQANLDNYGQRELVSRKMEWYEEDAGEQTLSEIVQLMERALR